MVAATTDTEALVDFVAGFCDLLGDMIGRQWAAPIVPIIARPAALPSLDALDLISLAALLLDETAGILAASPAARALLERGVGLRESEGRLVVVDRAAAARLTHLVVSATRPKGDGGALDLGAGLTMMIAPCGTAAPGVALVTIRTPPAQVLSTRLLRDLYGLTAAQAAVAERIAGGDTLEEVAAALAISLHTARSHLRQVFAKTGTARQSQLVSLLLRSVAACAVAPPDPA